jgi:FAD/FMN-containing dehydrogenase
VAPLEVRKAEQLADRAALWAFRRRTSKAVKVGAVGWRSDDVAVPLGAIPELLDFLPGLGERHDLIVCAYGHAGDGNMHVNLLWEQAGGEARVGPAGRELVDKTLALGGTISGEHGIGTLKKDALPRELGARQTELQQALRLQWDPRGILNPGKVF